MPTFTISVNNKALGTYVVKKTVISIGRSRTNTISIASKAVSRNHVRIENTAEGWTIADCGSLNGTYVNEIRINSAFLTEGDKITVGAYVITFSPEPVQSVSPGETHSASVQAAVPESTDTDVRVESTGAADTAAAPKEQSDIAEKNESVQPPPQTTSIPAQSVVEEVITSEALPAAVQAGADAEKVASPQARPPSGGQPDMPKKSDPSSLKLEDKVKRAISENPLADEAWIRSRLGESDFGGEKISKKQVAALLKQMDLDSSLKRYHYFMNS
jgi:pSer/pThr/pTyr-binding forkhead associated (FHA) protein